MLPRGHSIAPGYAEAHNNLGDVLHRAGQPKEAEACLRTALAISPDYPEALMNLGVLVSGRGEHDEAIALLERSLHIRPRSASGLTNLGNALRDSGRCDEAEARYSAALELAPYFPEAHYNRGLNRLMLGDFERGWHDHEWRQSCRSFDRRSWSAPEWDGSTLEGRTLLIHAEQGFGDTIQFIRYAAVAKLRKARVVVECPAALCELLSRTPGIDLLVPRGDALPPYDVQAPLMSLPRILGTSLDSIPGSVPYVFADQAREARWRRQVRTRECFTVGICWQGNPNYSADAQRSFPLAAAAPIARFPQVRLVSLQKGFGSEQIAGLRGLFEIEQFSPALDKGSGAFVDTAAILRSLDLVITPDTALAHLAGAMGVPVWVALPESGGWRWMLGRNDSPWYPSMRLFRTPATGTWVDVFEAMSRHLADEFSKGAEAPSSAANRFPAFTAVAPSRRTSTPLFRKIAPIPLMIHPPASDKILTLLLRRSTADCGLKKHNGGLHVVSYGRVLTMSPGRCSVG